MVGPHLRATQQEGNELRFVAGGRDHGLHRRVGQLGKFIAQQRLDDRGLHALDQRLGDHIAQPPAQGDQPAVIGRAALGAIQQVGVRERGAVLQESLGHLDIVAQQEAHQARRDLAQGRKTPGDAGAVLDRRVAQHVDQQVGGHASLEGVDPAGWQAHHVGEPLEEGHARSAKRRRGRRRGGL